MSTSKLEERKGRRVKNERDREIMIDVEKRARASEGKSRESKRVTESRAGTSERQQSGSEMA